jgi:hypothetical protein
MKNSARTAVEESISEQLIIEGYEHGPVNSSGKPQLRIFDKLYVYT